MFSIFNKNKNKNKFNDDTASKRENVEERTNTQKCEHITIDETKTNLIDLGDLNSGPIQPILKVGIYN